MFRVVILLCVLGCFPGAGVVRSGEPPLMVPYGEGDAPPGYLVFCRSHPDECRPAPGQQHQPQRMTLTSQRLAELDSVNTLVNMLIKPVSDMELYGEREFWTYPLKEGDCEDYVLLKRRMLLNRGWPESTLLITVVRDELGEGHAVLTVLTDKGDLILDNKQGVILPWHETAYVYIKRQSQHDPLIWVSLAPAPVAAENFAGLRTRRNK
jgi:predicted transglutaminase-like cysteine proteinase